jgi:hypothetical protein
VYREHFAEGENMAKRSTRKSSSKGIIDVVFETASKALGIRGGRRGKKKTGSSSTSSRGKGRSSVSRSKQPVARRGTATKRKVAGVKGGVTRRTPARGGRRTSTTRSRRTTGSRK